MSQPVFRVHAPDRAQCALVTEEATLVPRFIQHNQHRPDFVMVDRPQDADIVVLFEQHSFKLAPYADTLLGDPFFREHADRAYTVNYDSIGQGFLPGCYTSLRRGNFNPVFHRASAYPRTYNETLQADIAGDEEPVHLFSFRGYLKSDPIRRRILSELRGHPDGAIQEVDQAFHSHTTDQKTSYAREVRQSRFVLCPRGWSPSSYRLFEVMQLGRCPVIISDDWVPMAGIDWNSCSIRVAERDIRNIPGILRERAGESVALGANAAAVWQGHFSDPAKYRGYLDMVAELHASRSSPSVARLFGLDASRRRWRSQDFRWRNGWTLPQKIMRRVGALVRRTS